MLKLFILAFLACSLYTSQAQKTCDLSQFAQDPTVVETINGKVQGKCAVLGLSDPDLGSRSISVLSWLGIPFAQPPVGERRFMSPATPLNWTETRAATDFSKNCIQSGDANTMSEDCLYLNVYAPLQKSDKPLPVYIYVHAGGLVSGSGSSLNGAPIVAHSNIIVVTFNYRLGVMGFMHLPDLGITGNAGFLDQRMAFKWVYNNIGKFNGDKTKITIGNLVIFLYILSTITPIMTFI
jgi:para-nitrobenzyl esterase